MLIGGIQKTTLVDYPGKVAATIFTIGCNFRCSFCHNPEIVKGIAKVIPEKEIWDFLESRRNLIDAVCLTGGEPTLQSDIFSFIKKIKALGYAVKLDTNGLKPEVLAKLLNADLLDYVAMDIKAPWDKYHLVVARKVDVEKIKESVGILKNSNIPYEFRSTILPALHTPEDIVAMARQIKGAPKYFLQHFRPALSLVNESFLDKKPFTRKELIDIVQEFKEWFEVCRIR